MKIEVSKKDLRIETLAGKGPGGQHSNRNSTSVRITHIPTGITASANGRSQAGNKREAFSVLIARLQKHYESEIQISNDVKTAGFGAADVIRSYFANDDRIVDHDTGEKYSYNQTVGKGDMSKLIEDRFLKINLEDIK